MATIKVFGGLLLMILQVLQCYSDSGAMFPYGPSTRDSELSDRTKADFAQQIDLPNEGIVFFGTRHHNLVVSNHGTFYFTAGEPGYHIGATAPLIDSPPFAAPLYFGAGFLNVNPKGIVYYRSITGNTQRSPTLNQLSIMVNNQVVGVTSFNATFGVIVTWQNLTDSLSVIDCVHTGGDKCTNIPRNTFQGVLLADAENTFAIFNYDEVVMNAQDAEAGFYAGDRVRWTPVLPNNQRRIQDIESVHGTNGFMGRFIFKVSEHQVVRGGCYSGLTKAPLSASPTHAGMFGGEIIEVSGPCFNPHDVVHCKFGDTTVMGRRINYQKAACTVPLLTQRGKITLGVSASTPSQFDYSTNFTIVLPGRLQAGVKTDYLGPDQGWNETDASSLTLHWNSSRLSTDPKAAVEVNLIGYREDDTQSYWTTILKLADQVPNSKGTPSGMGLSTGVTFKPADFRCSGEQCHQYEVGIVEVKLVQGTPNTHSSLYSHNLPLGWFITEAMEQEHGQDWPSALCTMWDEADKQDSAWIEELLNCPCSMNQAMADFGRWQADVSCNIFTGSKCTYHKGAVHCVRSVQATPSGAGNQCCYSADGNLKYAADSFQGSTPDKGHAWGAAPYIKPGYVPEESHWIDDVVTFYYCCLWTGYSDCDKYMNRRPTRDCLNYQPPGTAIAFGDPHIDTFDGVSYRFHGRGEFTLLKIGTFSLQGRFSEPPMRSPINFNVSVLTAIALGGPNSDTVEVQLSPLGDGLMVMVNNDHLNFDAEGMSWQDFRGVSVVTEKGNRRHSNFTILLSSGIGVQVAENQGLLNVIASLPPGFKNGESRGLFGTWDGDQTNDFIPNTGTPGSSASIDTASSPEHVYTSFALTWEVEEKQSMFGAPEPRDNTFVPTFGDPEHPPSGGTRSLCQDNQHCIYDYRVTGDRILALGTYQASLWYKTLQDFLQPVDTCGLLDVPYAEKDSHDYTTGSTIHVTGCRLGFTLQGPTEYTCDSGKWTPEVTAKCDGGVNQAGLGMKIGIGLGVVGGMAVLVVIIVIVVRCRKSKGKGSESSAGTEMKSEQRVPGRSEYSPAKTSEDIEDMRPRAKPRTQETSADNSV